MAGALFGDELVLEYSTRSSPVSALMINGAFDASVLAAGGRPGGRFAAAWDGHATAPAAAQGTFWARAAGCEANPITTTSTDAVLAQYICPPGISVSTHLLKSQGHVWPGAARANAPGEHGSAGMSTTNLIWEFFKRRPKGVARAHVPLADRRSEAIQLRPALIAGWNWTSTSTAKRA